MTGRTEHEVQDPRKTWIYWVAIGLLVVFVVVGLFTFNSARSTAKAQDKADQMIAAIEAAGYHAPSQDQLVRVLGDDGGATCDDPGDALRRAALFSQLTNGAAGPGQRPTRVDSLVVQFQLLVVKTYCPDQLEDFQKTVDDLDFDDVVRG